MKFTTKQLKLLEKSYENHDTKNCDTDCCIFCHMDRDSKDDKLSKSALIDLIISTGAVPIEGKDFFTHDEILEIEKTASKSSDSKLRKKINQILKKP